ncbi:hypothetical protein FHL15_008510 [Xylaria flabelliformis]|uniref:Rhodopsin domain-containing protein n=1 Tax=Xylaria flabelliformis TaxID=2512241 RepID=A0A553HRF2_9PEZI|nr:hypothetical protein FHL15_008510 [Xylaria flabelliformis]
MDNDQQTVPAGDIGDHVLPKTIVILTGIVALVALIVRLLARHIMRRLGIADLLLVISMPKLIGTRNALFWILYGLIGSNAIFYLIGTFIEAFQCPPEDVGTPRCNIDVAKYNLASGVINVVSDLTILIAPHWVIWKLNLSKIRKIGVSVLFLIGALATGSAIARVIYVTNAYRTGDILFNVMTINLWAIAEQTFGYLVIGIPAIPKVLHDFPCAKRFGSLARSRSKQTATPSGGYHNRSTWPNSTPRNPRDVWDIGDLDTHVLVTIKGGEGNDIPLPGSTQFHGADESRNSSTDAVGVAVTRS